MVDGRINERILTKIKEKSTGNKNTREFLIDLVYFEADYPRVFKDYYLKRIKQHSEKS
jgi:hypothetical protein